MFMPRNIILTFVVTIYHIVTCGIHKNKLNITESNYINRRISEDCISLN